MTKSIHLAQFDNFFDRLFDSVLRLENMVIAHPSMMARGAY
jgi:hypothetical protein